MATRTKKAAKATKRTTSKSFDTQSTLKIQLPTRRLLRLGADANRSGMTISDYLLACELEFGHNLWNRPTNTKVGGTD